MASSLSKDIGFDQGNLTHITDHQIRHKVQSVVSLLIADIEFDLQSRVCKGFMLQ